MALFAVIEPIEILTTISKKLAFEDNCFCFQVTAIFYQKSEFLFNMFINSFKKLT